MHWNSDNNFKKVEELLASAALTPATRKALGDRIVKGKGKNHFFPNESFQLLSVICDLLLDQDSNGRMVNVAVFIDDRLAQKDGDGWRYSEMPPDDIMYLKGLAGIEETATYLFKRPFLSLEKQEQIRVLEAVQQGNAPGNIWKEMRSELFFEELLAEATEIFFSYPSVQIEINYTGMADGNGWQNIGLNEHD